MSCGCMNLLHRETGARYCVKKCPPHRAAAAKQLSLPDIEYYENLIPALKTGGATQHVAELEDALGQVPPSLNNVLPETAVEVGCGVSPYAGYLSALGYSYWGIDTHPGACSEMIKKGFRAVCTDFDRFALPSPVSLILSAHSLEHMKSAPDTLKHMFSIMRPGGSLYLVLPDDTDMFNPDHWWFFTEESLCRAVEQAGFRVLKSTTKSIVAKENFIYVMAERGAENVAAADRGVHAGTEESIPELGGN